MISTIAGTGTAGYSGDGGQATSAAIKYPHGIALDSSGNVYFSDNSNYRVRKITTSTGIISTYAGTGSTIYSGDGDQATAAGLYNLNGICIDSSGKNSQLLPLHHRLDSILLHLLDNVIVVCQFIHRIRKVTAATTVISTIAGSGTGSYSGDNGPATSASLNGPTGVAVDSAGKLA